MKYLTCFVSVFLLCQTTLFSQNIETLKDQKPAEIRGSITAQTGLYDASGIAPRNSPFFWNISGSLNIRLWNTLDLPFAFSLGRTGSRANYPTFTQFGLSPTYKWVTLHIGYRNMFFSPYTLAGHTFLGGGIELNPGKLRFAAMYGRLRNAAEVDTTRSFVEPAFKRIGYGMKLGYGSEQTHLDLILFKGKDDPNSLAQSDLQGLTPAENLVVGVNARITLFKNLQLNGNWAASAFTRDLNSLPVIADSLNGSIQQYLPDEILQTKASTRANLAGKTTLTWSKNSFRLNLEYEHIDPEYETMGAWFFANDLERYTVSPALGLWKNKVRVSGAYGIQRNNLLGNRLETTTRNIGAANLDINPSPKWGVNVNFSNYSIYQKSGTIEIDDTIAFNLQTTTFTVVPRLVISRENTSQNWSLVVNRQVSNQDHSAFFEQSQHFQSTIATLSHNLVFLSNNFAMQTSLNYHQFAVANLETRLYGGTLGLNLPVKKDLFRIAFSLSLNKRQLNKANDGATFNGYFNLLYKPAAGHSLTLSGGLLSGFGTISSDFSEWRANLMYTYRFGGQ